MWSALRFRTVIGLPNGGINKRVRNETQGASWEIIQVGT